MGADHAEAAGDGGAAAADIDLAGDIVEVDPLAVGGGDDALGAQNAAVTGLIGKRVQDAAQLVLGEAAGGLDAPAAEDLVGMVMVMMAVVVIVVIVVVVMILMIMMDPLIFLSAIC